MWGVLGLVVVTGVVVSACSSAMSPEAIDARPVTTIAQDDVEADEPVDTTVPDPIPDPEIDIASGVELADWGRCTDVTEFLGTPRLECATIEVPVDYDDPTGSTLPIALVRQPARSDQARIGSVVFNPGGPGGSGIEFLAIARLIMPDDVAEAFDLVSFDPRGVGRSASVNCDFVLDDGLVQIPDDDRDAWDAALADELDQLATCATTPADIGATLGTMNAARDLDRIREAVGDEALTYVGFSYGTRLGAVYADLFPDRIRALVLDGGVAPSTDYGSMAEQQGAGFDRALTSFADACDADPNCPLHDIGATIDVLDDVRDAIGTAGSFDTVEPGRVLTPAELDLGVIASLYNQGNWVYLALAMRDAATDADGSIFQALADSYLGRQPDGTYTNQVEAGAFINCADNAARPTVDEVWERADAVADTSEHFGDDLRAAFGCLGMPDPVEPLQFGRAEGAPPILVIGTSGDPATPYDWSVQLADHLDSGVLYSVDAEGHTAYLSIDCVQPVVNAYLIDLVVPDHGDGCLDDSDDPVFPPPGESEAEQVVAFFDCLVDNGADVDEIGIADVLRDPTGEFLFEVFDDFDLRATFAVLACQSLIF